MKRKRFKLLHSLVGVAILLIVESLLVVFFHSVMAEYIVIGASVIGAVGIVVVSTEVVREVRNADHMLFLLSAVMSEFAIFFACQYLFLSSVVPNSFQGLDLDPVSLLLNSVMIFALNPLYLPVTLFAKALLLVNTLGALSIVLFVLQNIWQFRGNQPAQDHL